MPACAAVRPSLRYLVLHRAPGASGQAQHHACASLIPMLRPIAMRRENVTCTPRASPDYVGHHAYAWLVAFWSGQIFSDVSSPLSPVTLIPMYDGCAASYRIRVCMRGLATRRLVSRRGHATLMTRHDDFGSIAYTGAQPGSVSPASGKATCHRRRRSCD